MTTSTGFLRDKATRLDAAFGSLLLAPIVIGFGVFGVYPLVEVFRLSTVKVNSLSKAEQFVGLDNYRRLLSDPGMPTVLANTGFFVVLLSVFGTALALGLALLVNQRLRGINFFRTAIFLPALISMVAWTIVWRYMLQPAGLFDGILHAFGSEPVPWLRSRWLTLTILVVVQGVKNVGLNMMILLAALQSVPNDLRDAASVDGAGKLRVFRSVVFPKISPSVLVVFMLMIIGSFKVFDLIYLLTQGGPGVSTTVLSYYIYSQAFQHNDIGYSSALSVVLFLLVLLISAVVWQLRRKFVSYE